MKYTSNSNNEIFFTSGATKHIQPTQTTPSSTSPNLNVLTIIDKTTKIQKIIEINNIPLSGELGYGFRIGATETNIFITNPIVENAGTLQAGSVDIYDLDGTFVSTILAPNVQTNGWFGAELKIFGNDVYIMAGGILGTGMNPMSGKPAVKSEWYKYDNAGTLIATYENPVSEGGVGVSYTTGQKYQFLSMDLLDIDTDGNLLWSCLGMPKADFSDILTPSKFYQQASDGTITDIVNGNPLQTENLPGNFPPVLLPLYFGLSAKYTPVGIVAPDFFYTVKDVVDETDPNNIITVVGYQMAGQLNFYDKNLAFTDTIFNPNIAGTKNMDYFGMSSIISGNYMIINGNTEVSGYSGYIILDLTTKQFVGHLKAPMSPLGANTNPYVEENKMNILGANSDGDIIFAGEIMLYKYEIVNNYTGSLIDAIEARYNVMEWGKIDNYTIYDRVVE